MLTKLLMPLQSMDLYGLKHTRVKLALQLVLKAPNTKFRFQK